MSPSVKTLLIKLNFAQALQLNSFQFSHRFAVD